MPASWIRLALSSLLLTPSLCCQRASDSEATNSPRCRCWSCGACSASNLARGSSCKTHWTAHAASGAGDEWGNPHSGRTWHSSSKAAVSRGRTPSPTVSKCDWRRPCQAATTSFPSLLWWSQTTSSGLKLPGLHNWSDTCKQDTTRERLSQFSGSTNGLRI